VCVCMRVYVCERERARESVAGKYEVRGHQRVMCVSVRVCVYVRDKHTRCMLTKVLCVCVYVCVCACVYVCVLPVKARCVAKTNGATPV